MGYSGYDSGALTAYKWSPIGWVVQPVQRSAGSGQLGAATSPATDTWISATNAGDTGNFMTHWNGGSWTQVNASFSVGPDPSDPVEAKGTSGSYWNAGCTQASSSAPAHPAIALLGPIP